MKRILCLALLLAVLLCACGTKEMPLQSFDLTGDGWRLGFGSREIVSENPAELYIAGYHNGWKVTEVRDWQRANAVWADAGGQGILLLSVDCVALSSGTVAKIRERLADFCAEVGCVRVNVCATHTHAGADTLGLWGEIAREGKDADFMETLTDSCVTAAKEAYADRRAGKLLYSETQTADMLRDSREPTVTDETLYQYRFVPADGTAGIRLISYSAHAESLRGANTALSRDYAGVLSDNIPAHTGDRVLFFQGAIGGLVMTKEFVSPFDAEENLRITGEKLTAYALSASPETELAPRLTLTVTGITVPLDNTLFAYYKFLGILDEPSARGDGETELRLYSEMGLLQIGDRNLLLVPGELFPELLLGGYKTDGANPAAENPTPLRVLAAEYGLDNLAAVGLCNDELGYIVPPNDWELDGEAPYINHTSGHYEETNSCGIRTAAVIAAGAEKLFRAVAER